MNRKKKVTLVNFKTLPHDFLTNQKKVRELTPEEKKWINAVEYEIGDVRDLDQK